MTSPQDPRQQGWQQGGYQQYPSGGFPQQGPASGGFPQQGPPPGALSQQGFQQYPQGGYQANNPYAAPPVSMGEMAAVPRPATVTIAFWIAVAVPLIATVLLSLSGLSMQKMFNSVAGGESDEVTSAVNTFAVWGTGIFVFFCAIMTGLWILFGFQMRKGQNWARVLLVVVGSFWFLQAVGGLIGTSSTAGSGDNPMPAEFLALTYSNYGLVVVSMIAFVVLVFMPQSNWYFQAAGRR